MVSREGPSKEFTISVLPNVELIPIDDITIRHGEAKVDFETNFTGGVISYTWERLKLFFKYNW